MERSKAQQVPEEALTKVESLLAHEPDSVAHLFARARLLDALGRNDAARLAYIDLLRRDGSHPEGLTSLASLLSKLGQHSAALATLRRVVETHPTQSSAHANYATFLAKTENSRRRACISSRPSVSTRPTPSPTAGSPSFCCDEASTGKQRRTRRWPVASPMCGPFGAKANPCR